MIIRVKLKKRQHFKHAILLIIRKAKSVCWVQQSFLAQKSDIEIT